MNICIYRTGKENGLQDIRKFAATGMCREVIKAMLGADSNGNVKCFSQRYKCAELAGFSKKCPEL